MGATLPTITVSLTILTIFITILTILITITSIICVCIIDLIYCILSRRLALCQRLLMQCLMSSLNKSMRWVVTLFHSTDENVEARRNKSLIECHIASKWQSWHLNPCLTPEPSEKGELTDDVSWHSPACRL